MLADVFHRTGESRLMICGPCGPLNKTGPTAWPKVRTGLRHPGEVPSLVPTAVVQLLTPVWLFVTPWTAAHQASLSFTVYPRVEHGNPLQYSYLENSMDTEVWQATVHGATESLT